MAVKVPSLFRLDGWKSVLAGFNTKKDKSVRPVDSVGGMVRLTPVALGLLYRTNGDIRNAMDMPAEDMVRCGFEVEGDDGALWKAYNALQGPSIFEQALKDCRLYGGSIIIMDVEGAGGWDTPWDYSKGRIRSLREYPRTRVLLPLMETTKIPESIYFDDYEVFKIDAVTGVPFSVHASRVLVFKSETKIDALEPGYLDYERFWGLSEVYRGLDDAYGFGTTKKGTAHLLQECSVGKYTLSNLEQLISESNWRALDARLEAMDEQKSVINGIFLGEGENYTRENVTFSGVPELWDRQMMAVAGAYRVPVTKLYGRSAAGMNATGEGDDDNWNAYVSGLQETQLKPPLHKFMTALNARLKVVDTSKVPLAINFNPISKRDQKKDAEVREIMSRADRNYVEAGILHESDILANRFLGGYKIDTSVEDDRVPDLSKEE